MALAIPAMAIEQADSEDLKNNIRYALTLPLPHVDGALPADEKKAAAIVGSGPSVAGYVDELKWQKSHGIEIWAVGSSFQWLVANGIEPDRHVLLDGSPETAALVPEKTVAALLYASQCHPDVFEKASHSSQRTLIWHSQIDGIIDLLGGKKAALIGFGSTVGMKAIGLAYVLGLRTLYLYGFDSSYQNDLRSVHGKNRTDGEPVINVQIEGQVFATSPRLAEQAKQLCETISALEAKGCMLAVQGEGFLSAIMRKMNAPKTNTQDRDAEQKIKQIDGLWWPKNDVECRKSVIKTLDDVRHILKFCWRRGTAVQAGGNVGVWPLEFAKYFAHVLTFEPDPLNFECLLRNTANVPNIDKLKFGLGSQQEKVGLSRMRGNCGAHFVQGNGDIAIITIDDMQLQGCDLMQLDIEGYEYKALLGGIETIRRFKPVIVTEEKRLGERYGTKDEEIGKLLQPLGYKVVGKMHRDVIYVAEA